MIQTPSKHRVSRMRIRAACVELIGERGPVRTTITEEATDSPGGKSVSPVPNVRPSGRAAGDRQTRRADDIRRTTTPPDRVNTSTSPDRAAALLRRRVLSLPGILERRTLRAAHRDRTSRRGIRNSLRVERLPAGLRPEKGRSALRRRRRSERVSHSRLRTRRNLLWHLNRGRNSGVC